MEPGVQRNVLQLFIGCIIPVVLLITTAFTCLTAGSFLAGYEGGGPLTLVHGALFGFPLMLAIGAHAGAHYFAARRCGVGAYPPYFLPATTLSGTSGAYTKLSWPIADRNALICIFAAGPLAGFAVSTAFLLLGFAISGVQPRQLSSGLTFGDSVLTRVFQELIFPGMSETHDVVLHPIGLAGWLGLYSNLWHLFPAGRFDGGRLAYALWGYKRANTLGWLTIAVLVVLGSAWPGWWVMAAFAAITMIRIRTQHPIDAHAEPINTSARRLIWACAAVLALTFVPVPVRFSPPPDTEGVISRREVETWPCPCLTSPGGWRTQGGVEFFV